MFCSISFLFMYIYTNNLINKISEIHNSVHAFIVSYYKTCIINQTDVLVLLKKIIFFVHYSFLFKLKIFNELWKSRLFLFSSRYYRVCLGIYYLIINGFRFKKWSRKFVLVYLVIFRHGWKLFSESFFWPYFYIL